MSVRRSINTKIWSDEWVETLSMEEKLLWLYLLTNAQTNMLGIYEITIRRIAFETGMKEDVVRKALKGFERLRKAFEWSNWIVLPNWMKNQSLNTNMIKSAREAWGELPNWLISKLKDNGFEAFESLSKGSATLRNIEVEDEREDEGESPQGNPPSFLPSEVIQLFNEITNSEYSEKAAKNIKPVSARIKEGATMDDFTLVIRDRYSSWKNDAKMKEFIRPETVFGSKFEGYLQNAKKQVSHDPETKYRSFFTKGWENCSEEERVWGYDYQHRTADSYLQYPDTELLGNRGGYKTKSQYAD